jgi:hypothetical protein
MVGGSPAISPLQAAYFAAFSPSRGLSRLREHVHVRPISLDTLCGPLRIGGPGHRNLSDVLLRRLRRQR